MTLEATLRAYIDQRIEGLTKRTAMFVGKGPDAPLALETCWRDLLDLEMMLCPDPIEQHPTAYVWRAMAVVQNRRYPESSFTISSLEKDLGRINDYFLAVRTELLTVTVKETDRLEAARSRPSDPG
jgi:hypothetical protein